MNNAHNHAMFYILFKNINRILHDKYIQNTHLLDHRYDRKLNFYSKGNVSVHIEIHYRSFKKTYLRHKTQRMKIVYHI